MIKRKAFCEFGAYAVDVRDLAKIEVMLLREYGDFRPPIRNTTTLDFNKVLDLRCTQEKFDE